MGLSDGSCDLIVFLRFLVRVSWLVSSLPLIETEYLPSVGMRLGFLTGAKELLDVVDLHTSNTNLQPRYTYLSNYIRTHTNKNCIQFHHPSDCLGSFDQMGTCRIH